MRKGKVCLGVFFIIGALIYIIIAVMEAAVRVPMIVLAALFLLFAFLLLRKKKEKPAAVMPEPSVSVSFAPREVPEEILKQMRKAYTKANALQDAQIMRESFLLCQQTIDFDVFCAVFVNTNRCAWNDQTKQACRQFLGHIPAKLFHVSGLELINVFFQLL